MAWTAKLYFYHLLFYVIFFIYFDIIVSEEWRSEYTSLFYNVFPISNSILIVDAILSDTKTATSVTSCSLFCMKSESISFYYKNDENMCYCNNDFDTRLSVDNQTEDASSETVYGIFNTSMHVSRNDSVRRFDIQPYKMSCFDLYRYGFIENAIYVIKPNDGNSVIDIFCDMDNVGADDCLQWLQFGYLEDGVYKIHLSNGATVDVWCDQTNGGWTVIQRRQDGSVDFYRSWTEYVDGFGDISGEYWLGLEAIYFLSKQPSSLLIDMEAFEDEEPRTAYALYSEFAIQPATDKYRLYVNEFTGDCNDSLSFQNTQQFSTWDEDNDNHLQTHCAVYSQGAWWYNDCHYSNLNGLYGNNSYGKGVNWKTCWGYDYSIKACSMKLKRN